jgi:hypothetical protein
MHNPLVIIASDDASVPSRRKLLRVNKDPNVPGHIDCKGQYRLLETVVTNKFNVKLKGC